MVCTLLIDLELSLHALWDLLIHEKQNRYFVKSRKIVSHSSLIKICPIPNQRLNFQLDLAKCMPSAVRELTCFSSVVYSCGICRYGMKIRFPHALVMTFLFHEGT